MNTISNLSVLPAKQSLPQPDSGGLSTHILPTSATMVGVCVTVIGIVKLFHAGALGIYVDKLLALDSALFVASAVLSFVSLRKQPGAGRMETLAEEIFLLGLMLMGLASLMLAFTVT